MRLLYTNDNRLIVANARNIVEAAGIGVVLKNEYAAGGIGELSAFDAWVELWVTDDSNYDRASRLLKNAFSAENAVPWTCSNCNESNDPSFDLCWNCLR